MKQAASASRAASSLLEGSAASGDSSEAEKKLKEKDAELTKAKKDLEAMKSQAEGLNKEYDRLCEENAKLERQLKVRKLGIKPIKGPLVKDQCKPRDKTYRRTLN